MLSVGLFCWWCMFVFFLLLLLWLLFLSPRRKQPGSLLSFSAGIHQITVTFNRSRNCPVLFDICLFVVSQHVVEYCKRGREQESFCQSLALLSLSGECKYTPNLHPKSKHIELSTGLKFLPPLQGPETVTSVQVVELPDLSNKMIGHLGKFNFQISLKKFSTSMPQIPHDLLLSSCSVTSDSLRHHGLQHVRLPCPSPSPRDCSNSCPLS